MRRFRNWMNLLATAGLISGTNASPAVAGPARPMVSTRACDLATFKAPANTTLTSAKLITTPVSYCRIDGYVTTTNPGPNKVRFMVAVPQKWNGRFLFTVQGGAAGFVPDPAEEHLNEGYAIGSTDKGVVTSNTLDFSFRSNPAMNLDWNYRGTHVAAVATQSLVRGFYGRQKLYRYIMGCSGGGVGTLTEAEMFPTDFDGFIAGATSTDWPYSTPVIWARLAQHVSKTPGAWISPADYARVQEAMLAKHDGGDGAVDGLIWNPQAIKLDAGDRETLSFLTDAQFETLKLIIADVRNAKGETVHPGYLFANVKRWPLFLTGLTPPPWKGMQDYPAGFVVTDSASKAAMGPTFSYLDQPDVMTFERPPGMEGPHFDHRRLAALDKAGSKLIMWTGIAEEAVPPGNTLGYNDRASATFGAAKRATFLRAFAIPGLHHCQGGDNAPTNTIDQLLKASQRWVELGEAPSSVILANGAPGGIMGAYPAEMMRAFRRPGMDVMRPNASTKATRTYLVCAYPARSVFKGGADNPDKLDVNDAANWHCQP